MTPSWRKPAGALGICALIVVWCVAVASLAGPAARWPWPVQLVFYLIAGTVWIAPLKPVLRWMEGASGGTHQ